VADTSFTIVVGIAFTLAYGAFLAATGMPQDEVQEALGTSNPAAFFTVAMLAIGGAGSFIGGYLCARIAKHREYALAAALTIISLALGWIITPEDETAAMILMGTIITVALTPAGAWCGVRKNRMGR
jgi:methyl coenzyme M reductase beta subunit